MSARRGAVVLVFIEVVLGDVFVPGVGRRRDVAPGLVHWVRERGDVGARAWGGEIGEAIATSACGLRDSGTVSDRRTAEAISCHECQVLYAAEALSRETCQACDGAGVASLPPTRGLFTCRACGGTGMAG